MKPRFAFAGLSLLAALLVLALYLWGGGPWHPAYRFQGSVIEPPLPASDFQLTDQFGRPYRLSEHRNQIVLLFFGYTYCPDVCPATLSDFRRIFAEFGERADVLQFAFITVDPERDSPDLLARHLAKFNEHFVGLTGDLPVLEQVWRSYGVFRQSQQDESVNFYLVDHTSRIYVIDAAGNLRVTFPYGLSREAMAADLAYLVSEIE